MIPPAALPTPPVAPSPATSQIDAYQPGVRESSSINQAFSAAMDGFSARSAQMQASVRDIVARDTGSFPGAARPSAAGDVASPTSPSNTAKPGGVPGPMALMVDSFNFAIEASLVSRAATQFTGSMTSLMKGQ